MFDEVADASWAFATTAALESAFAITRGVSVNFSEQQLIDCSGMGCHGGSPINALEYLARNVGMVTLNDYPYLEYPDTCKMNSSYVREYLIISLFQKSKQIKSFPCPFLTPNRH
jgi:hypothetical protein